jgi:hypothetical protein
MPLKELPLVDEHSAVAAAPPEAVWDALLDTLRSTFAAPAAQRTALLLGCDPSATNGWDHPAAGSSVPGFSIVVAERPALLAVAGRHRFSRYGIVVRIEPAGGGARCRAETRAAFPGPHGALYRLAVIGTGGHAIAVRRLLRRAAGLAEARSGTTLP